jgi:general secretion pathway protein N
MFAPLPLRALELQDTTVRFSDGRCVEASGRISPVIEAPVPGFDFAGLSGEVTCEGERARVTMNGRNGETIEFYVHASGLYRGWISIRQVAPPLAATLAGIGFRPSPQGLTLSVDGRL